MTVLSNKDIAKAIYSALKEKNYTEQTSLFRSVVDFLGRKRLLNRAPGILLSLEKIINESEGKVVVKIYSKNDLGEKIKNELKHLLAKKYNAKEIILIPVLDDKYLGGFKIEVNDEIIDLTVKNKIIKLQDYLTKSL